MASEIVRIINCGEGDSENINSLLEKYLCKSRKENIQ